MFNILLTWPLSNRSFEIDAYKKAKDIQATHSSRHESFIYLDTVGPGLGAKCIFKRKAAKMLRWNFAPWIFREGRLQPRLQMERCRGSLWRNTDMNPPQEVVRSPRQQPQPGCFFASPLPEAPKQWNSWVGRSERQCGGRLLSEEIEEQPLSIEQRVEFRENKLACITRLTWDQCQLGCALLEVSGVKL